MKRSMKRRRVFIHTLRLPRLRLAWFLPLTLALLLIFVAVPLLLERQQASASLPNTPVQVMIDPGHGGYDPGVKTGQYVEADITLAIGKQLQAELQKRGITAALTRETDTDYAERGQKGKTAKRADLGKRIELTQAQNGQVFVSLHCNNSTVATRGGAEVFYNTAPGGKEFGESVQNALHTMPDMSKRDAKNVDYYLLRNQTIPAIIIECGYLNISADRQRLTTPTYQAKLAAAIADGIEAYLKNPVKADPEQQKEQAPTSNDVVDEP